MFWGMKPTMPLPRRSTIWGPDSPWAIERHIIIEGNHHAQVHLPTTLDGLLLDVHSDLRSVDRARDRV